MDRTFDWEVIVAFNIIAVVITPTPPFPVETENVCAGFLVSIFNLYLLLYLYIFQYINYRFERQILLKRIEWKFKK
jgi:hypothetical protein